MFSSHPLFLSASLSAHRNRSMLLYLRAEENWRESCNNLFLVWWQLQLLKCVEVCIPLSSQAAQQTATTFMKAARACYVVEGSHRCWLVCSFSVFVCVCKYVHSHSQHSMHTHHCIQIQTDLWMIHVYNCCVCSHTVCQYQLKFTLNIIELSLSDWIRQLQNSAFLSNANSCEPLTIALSRELLLDTGWHFGTYATFCGLSTSTLPHVI